MHGSIQVLMQAHKSILTLLTCSYQQETSARTNVNDAFTRALLPGTRRNSK